MHYYLYSWTVLSREETFIWEEEMKAPKTIFSAAVALAMSAGAVVAKTEVHWWHALGGTNGERVDKIAADFNASQSDYEIIPTYKGNY